MKVKKVNLRNFRRLEDIEIDFEEKETVFVGPNNSGKTSATSAFKLFLEKLKFQIHDFSVSKITEIDNYGRRVEEAIIPSIEMDIWLSFDPEIEYGRVASLIPNVSTSLENVGVGIQYRVDDQENLLKEYYNVFPERQDGTREKSLSQYLGLSNNLSRHFSIVYWTLEKENDQVERHYMDADEAKRTLSSIIRVDFVNAQRNIDDYEASRSTRLSQAFGSYYKNNLEEPEINEEANRVITENNEKLTDHYEKSFENLMGVIKNIGVPSVNDRELKIISSLNPESALKGNTSLLYVDPSNEHELPEAYNGLGFKNLIYVVIRTSHYYLQWLTTENKRPLCQLIFIEEPEVHLHSQVQQTFIANLWSIIDDLAEEEDEPINVPQLCVTTHSSHILDAVDFEKVRYFKKCYLHDEDPDMVRTQNASEVLSLRTFRPNRESASGFFEDGDSVLRFLKKYMKLTHCDLFFSDAAILVEGAAEKLLLPSMIKQVAPALKRNYISVLEVGGAYSHRFSGLLEFIGIPYLVITDIDSVDPANNRSACKADHPGAVTSNSSIKFFLGEDRIDHLKILENDSVKVANNAGYIAFQKPTETPIFGDDEFMYGRTFEECFIYENLQLFKDEEIKCEVDINENAESVRNDIYEHVKSSTFKKTNFALDMASTEIDWMTPTYITEGLKWLFDNLNSAIETQEEN
jgi:predicted ATP-dependent endonuclease of OLD family